MIPICYLVQVSPTTNLSMRHLSCNSSKLGLREGSLQVRIQFPNLLS